MSDSIAAIANIDHDVARSSRAPKASRPIARRDGIAARGKELATTRNADVVRCAVGMIGDIAV
jgi:hypothetical protein